MKLLNPFPRLTYVGTINESEVEVNEFKSCHDQYIDYTPSQDQVWAMTFMQENMIYKERHCPLEKEILHYLIPPTPKGYMTPFPWLQSCDYA